MHEAEVRPGLQVVRLRDHDLLEQHARLLGLAGLEIAEREVLTERRIAGERPHQLFVNLDGARIEPETKIHDREQVLPLGVARLKLQRLLQLLLGLVDAVVLEELAPAVQVEEKILGRVRATAPIPSIGRLSPVALAAFHGGPG